MLAPGLSGLNQTRRSEAEFAGLAAGIDSGGKSHHRIDMPTSTKSHSGPKIGKNGITVVHEYDVAADAKKRISLRGATGKYFRVKSLSNGSFLLEPQVLISRDAIPPRTLKMLEKSVGNLKGGKASASIDLTPFADK
jgi:hypothetical protein